LSHLSQANVEKYDCLLPNIVLKMITSQQTGKLRAEA